MKPRSLTGFVPGPIVKGMDWNGEPVTGRLLVPCPKCHGRRDLSAEAPLGA